MSSQDTEKLKSRFLKLVQTDERQAVRSLNHEALKFPSLFTIRHDIYSANLFSRLNERNQWALKLTEEFLDEGDDFEAPVLSQGILVSESLLTIHSALRWMVKTGGLYTLSSSYMRVIDRTCIYVLNVFSDQSALPDVVDIVFYRHKKGLYYNHLCWSVFETGNPDCLLHFGKRLLSSDPNDQSLALNLLSFVPALTQLLNPEEQYELFSDWFDEHRPYLVYNEENFDMTSNPIPFVPSLEAKYFGNGTSQFTDRFKETEQQLVQEFGKLDQQKQQILADGSLRLRQTNRNRWKKWLTLSFDEQLNQIGEWLP